MGKTRDEGDPEIGRRIAEARQAKGWSQGELAEAYGCSRPNISQWENGKTLPPTAHLRRLCGLLGCDVGWLVTGAVELAHHARPSLSREPPDLLARIVGLQEQSLGTLNEIRNLLAEPEERPFPPARPAAGPG